jgi:thioredoxin 1
MLVYLGDASNFNKEVSEGTVLVDFYADWCGPCRMLGPVLEEVSKERDDVKILKVNVDELPSVASRFSVYSIPTMVLFKGGQPVASQVGYIGKAALLRLIDNN